MNFKQLILDSGAFDCKEPLCVDKKLGFPNGTTERFIHNAQQPKLDQLVALKNHFGMNTDWLMTKAFVKPKQTKKKEQEGTYQTNREMATV